MAFVGCALSQMRAACAAGASDGGGRLHAGAGSAGDATITLLGHTGLAVLDLRASIKRDACKIKYLGVYEMGALELNLRMKVRIHRRDGY